MKRNNGTFRITTKNTLLISFLSAIAKAACFWLFVTLDMRHELLPGVPFTKHFRQNTSSPKFGELGHNRGPVFCVRCNSLVKKCGCTTPIKSSHNKVTVLSFHCKNLLLRLIMVLVVSFKPKISSAVFRQA